jgi:MurNAc alpha-1-phosphate uridylyltransferase
MILAAGRGERMRPLTDQTPKSLLRVQGQTLIDRHLSALAQAGFTHVCINLGHLGHLIREHVGDGQQFNLNIRYAQEPEGALETAGGIVTAHPWSDERQTDGDPFLVVNADVFTDFDFNLVHDQARDLRHHKALAHLILVPNPPQHPEGDFSLQTSPGWVAHPQPGQNMTFSGIGIYEPELFQELSPNLRAPLAPLLKKIIAQQCCRGAWHLGRWSDVGTPERLAALNLTT